ncbi:hypothetical protein KKC08_00805 [Patescibacteria group bacterium]|nr:hypothetical protein [Patescibacteria group bacterium]MCG2701770.1 hypothetical protein [Candidatus Parcubacteria bacterium]MBU4264674.1 hypothetical protein [Patescibacteria group bacterium]MBU4390629.1 hypothetical protein [Patescibacteria group bacterium]MBU4396692.1 hypothetical protein [Patescibacteria group bacterium]
MNKLKNIAKWILFLPISQLLFFLVYIMLSYGYMVVWEFIKNQNFVILILLLPAIISAVVSITFYLNLFSAFITELISPNKTTYFLSFGLLVFRRLKTTITYSPVATTTDNARIIDMPMPMLLIVYSAQLLIVLIYGLFKYHNKSDSDSKKPILTIPANDPTKKNIGEHNKNILIKHKPQPYNPIEFPTLVKYNDQQIEDAIQKLMKEHGMTRHQCLVNLEQDLSEIEARATGK